MGEDVKCPHCGETLVGTEKAVLTGVYIVKCRTCWRPVISVA